MTSGTLMRRGCCTYNVSFDGDTVGPLLDVTFLPCRNSEGSEVLEEIMRDPDSVEGAIHTAPAAKRLGKAASKRLGKAA